MNKQTKRIVACFSVVVVLVISLALPSFAYYDSMDTTLGNRTYYTNFPIRFNRSVLTAYGVRNVVSQEYTETWISEADLPTEFNTNLGVPYAQKQELIDRYSDDVLVSRGHSTTYTNYFKDNDTATLGCNYFNSLVAESTHHRLDLYADIGLFTKGDLDNGFFITLNDVNNITRSRISFDLIIPTVETVGASDDEYEYFYNIQSVTVQCDRVVGDGDQSVYKLFDFDDISQYYDGTQLNFDEFPNTPIMITNVRYTAIFDRPNGGGNGENYDFSFMLEYSVSSDRFSLFDLNSLEIYMPIYPSYEGISFNDISVVDWAITQINSILALELIPYISIGAILWFVVGLSLFFFTLKMFLGG